MLLISMTIIIDGDPQKLKAFKEKVKEEAYFDDFLNSNDDVLFIESPARVGVEYELEPYEEWYVDFIEKYYPEMEKAGMQEIEISINVFYAEQCNFSIFNRDKMMRLGKYPIAYPVSVYRTKMEELEEIKSLRQ